MPDLIRHPCVKGDGPRVKPGVTEGEVKPGVTREGVMPKVAREGVMPGVTTEGGVREMSGMKHPHMRATPKLVARG
jgi:hypothetical protein